VRWADITRTIRKPVLWLALGMCFAQSALATPFPQPKALQPDVDFWVRVYSELDTRQGVIHDARKLGIVYEKVTDLPAETTDARREVVLSRVHAVRDRLLRLSLTGATPNDAEDRRLLKILNHPGHAQLRAAAENVRFQSGQADRFRQGLERASAWRPQIEQMFVAAGLPIELASLPHVESSFDPEAYSKVGAAGLWQLMRATGRLYIRVDDHIDERFDPMTSTTAAIAYFREAHDALGSWPLAVVSYNSGVNGMKNAKRKLGTSDIVSVVRHYRTPAFRFASRNFYPSFLAALEVERRADELFGSLQQVSNWQTCKTALLVDVPVATIAATTGFPLEQLKIFNPALRSSVWSGVRAVPAGYALRLPFEAVATPKPVTWIAWDDWRAEHSATQPAVLQTAGLQSERSCGKTAAPVVAAM